MAKYFKNVTKTDGVTKKGMNVTKTTTKSKGLSEAQRTLKIQSQNKVRETKALRSDNLSRERNKTARATIYATAAADSTKHIADSITGVSKNRDMYKYLNSVVDDATTGNTVRDEDQDQYFGKGSVEG